tara:strand:- start:118 stop:558 length:441 start_codon:yes stop_codon:yes gene_type:complete
MPRGKKECPCCSKFIASRASSCECGHIFKRKKKNRTSVSKKEILYRLVDVPAKGKNNFYAREFRLLNILIERYSLEFISVVTFERKFDSLSYLVSEKLKETLDKKFRSFNYKFDPSRYDVYTLGEKTGEDAVVTKNKKTIKQFLND